MSSYHTSFTYNGLSSIEKGVILASFNADDGETDSFLSMENISSETNFGVRHEYGARHDSVAEIKMTLLRFNGNNFTVESFRDVVRWLTGAKKSSWLNLYENDKLAYSFLGKFTDVQQYKIDAVTIGIVATFTANSPWAYSDVNEINTAINGDKLITIYNKSDNLYSYVDLDITFKNINGTTLSIYNKDTNETTQVEKLDIDETITIDHNKIIYSSKDNKVFGNTFNFSWPRLAPGINNFTVSGNGELYIKYRYPIKAGDCVMDIDVDTNMNCGLFEEASRPITSNDDVIKSISNIYNGLFTNSMVDYVIGESQDTYYTVGGNALSDRDLAADTTTGTMFLDAYRKVFGGDC